MKRAKGKAGTSKRSAAEKKRLWIEAMLANGGNQTQAAVAAGFTPGSAAEKAGYRMSKDVRVMTLLEKRRAEVLAEAQDKTQLTVEEVLRSLARDVRFDPAKLLNPDGSLKPVHEMDEDTRLALRGMEVDVIKVGRGKDAAIIGHTVKVKYPEKTAARDQAMKHFGLYKRDNEQQPVVPAVVLPPGTKSIRMDFGKVKARAKAAAQRA